MRKKSVNRRGFTLVEMMVTIAIISVLSTISFISYTSYVSDARDSKRVSDVSLTKSALNAFAKDHEGTYPSANSLSGTIVMGGPTNIVAYQSYMDSDFLRSIGISQDLKDPKGGNFYVYSVSKDTKSYQLSATLESSNNNLALISPIESAYAASCGDLSAYVDGNFIPTDKNVLPGLIYAFDIKTQPSLDISINSNLKKVVLNNQTVNMAYAFGDGLSCDGDVFATDLGTASNSMVNKNSCVNSQGITIPHGTNEMLDLSGSTLNSQMGWKYKTCNNGVMDKNGVGATGDSDYYYSCRDIGLGSVFDSTCHWTGCSAGFTIKGSGVGCDPSVSAVTLASPQNGAFWMPTGGFLTWYPSKQAGGNYKVFLGTSNNTFEIINGSSVSDTSVSYTSLTPNKSYFWKVQACDASANCKDSAVYSFFTAASGAGSESGGTGNGETAYCPGGIICRSDDVSVSFIGCNSGNSSFNDCSQNNFGTSERDGDNFFGKTKTLGYKIANDSDGYARFKVSLATAAGSYADKNSSSIFESSYALDLGGDGIANNLYWQMGDGCMGDGATGYSVGPKTTCYISLTERSDPTLPSANSTIAKLRIANTDTANGSWPDFQADLKAGTSGYSASPLSASMSATKYKQATEPTVSTAVQNDFDVSTVASGATYGAWKALTYVVTNSNTTSSYFVPGFIAPDSTLYTALPLGSTGGTNADFNTALKMVDIGNNGIGNLYWNNGDMDLQNTCQTAGAGLRVSAGSSCMITLFFRADAAISASRTNFLSMKLLYQPVADQSSIGQIALFAQKSGGNATLFTGYFPYSQNGWWIDFSTFQIQNDLTPAGFVWSNEMGWIDMSGSGTGSTIEIYHDGDIRRIKGKTLGQTAWWIDFNKTGDPAKQTYIGSDGKMHGWAWSDNYGWISFDNGVQQ